MIETDTIKTTSKQLNWEIWFKGRTIGKQFIVVMTSIVASLIVWYFTRNELVMLLAIVCILSYVPELFYPTRFKIDSKGVYRRCGLGGTNLEWKNIKRIEIKDKGVYLSSIEKPSILDQYRGIYLLFEKNKALILDLITFYSNEKAIQKDEQQLAKSRFIA